jgi:hypothetical protein
MADDTLAGLRAFLTSSGYLPAPLRDFHDAKDVFKCVAEYREQKEPFAVNWMNGQVYVIDHFLPFMGAHGWTLQRSRRPITFCDLNGTIAERRAREVEVLRAALREPP